MNPDTIEVIGKIGQMFFIAALGACLGTLINVLVYRLPLGLDVIRPASRCPSCETRLTWRENIPIVGWIALGGRCRFCKSPISPEYPIVEAFVAGLFALAYFIWYLIPDNAAWFGMDWSAWTPEWAANAGRLGGFTTWPIAATLFVLFASLVAMTLIDARTFTIPLVLTWVPACVAVVLLPGHALWFELQEGAVAGALSDGVIATERGTRWLTADGWLWAVPTAGLGGWSFIGGAIGGVAGIPVSLLLIRLGLIRRSFDDYAAWEEGALKEAKASDSQEQGDPGDADAQSDDPAIWIRYPHARREMIKELAFCAPIVVLSIVGAWASDRIFTGAAPLWLVVLGGVLTGYLTGGAVVWAIRIAGSLAFGKEAMGLGDVHLMAAVGACTGWIDATLAFFASAFIGLSYAIAQALVGGRFDRAMPYGPYLAIATVLVILGKPLAERFLSLMLQSPIDLP